jgi:hypothetical protein
MGIRKTDQDCRREKIADEWNRKLVGSPFSVVAGGRRGPYTLVIEGLSREKLERWLEAMRVPVPPGKP